MVPGLSGMPWGVAWKRGGVFVSSLPAAGPRKHERFALNKRALMLSAAIAALASGSAFAQTTINSQQTSPVSTSSDGMITITSSGSVVISGGTTPAVTINGSPNSTPGDVLNQGTISFNGLGSSSAPVTGVELVGGNTGGLDSTNIIELTGAGDHKTGILIGGGGAFLGDIKYTGDNSSTGTALSSETGITGFPNTVANSAAILLESGSTLKVQGDDSFGINLASGTTLGQSSTTDRQGDIDIFGTLTMTPSSSSSTASTSSAINIAGTMYGNINLVSGSSVTVQGNAASTGITIASTGSLNGDGNGQDGNINIGGTLALTPVSATEANGGNIAVDMAGTMSGHIANDGNISATGTGAKGIQVTGTFAGFDYFDGKFDAPNTANFIENTGTLETIGTASPSTTAFNPEAGPALAIGSSIGGGIANFSQSGSAASISTIGGGTNYTIDIDPAIADSASPGSLVISPFTLASDASGNHFAFFNSGTIAGSPGDNPNTSLTTFFITGQGSNAVTTLTNGVYNSGTIKSSAFTDTNATAPATATSLEIGPYTHFTPVGGTTLGTSSAGQPLPYLGGLENAPGGTITASVTGAEEGTAYGIQIGQPTNNASIGFGEIYNAGAISADVTTTNLNITNSGKSTPVFAAYGIYDNSGSLTSIINSGTISALATKLNDSSQVAEAINVNANIISAPTAGGVDIENTGTITGDIVFGSGADTLHVYGTSKSATGVVNGNIDFGSTGNGGNKNDTLDIGLFGTVSGYVQETHGDLDVHVENGGTLNLLAPPIIGSTTVAPPAGTPLNVGTLTVDGNGNPTNSGTLNIAVSQGYDILAYPTSPGLAIINAANAATLNGTVTVSFGSFISAPSGKLAEFALIAAPAGKITGAGLSTINQSLKVPYLYTGSACLWNPGGVSTCTSGTNPIANDSVLELTLQPKAIGLDGCTEPNLTGCNPTHIPLTGYAATLYPYANAALGTDNALGAAMISAIGNASEAESAYASFAPDVTGATRAVAISLTDDASNVVAARQRELRQYANQDGDLTLWGQEFAQRLDQKSTSAGIPGYKDSGFGFAVGADEGDPEDGRYGGAFEFFNGGAREDAPGNSKTTSEWYMLTGYTDWRGKGLFLDTQASVGYVNLKGNRYLNLTIPGSDGSPNVNFDRNAFEQHPGEYLAGSAMTGAIFDEDGTVFTPEVSLDGLVMREESYTESGGGNGFDLHVASSYAQSLRAFTGVDVRQDVDLTDFLLQPELRVGYRYDFANGAQSLKANFPTISPESVFKVTGPQPEKGNLVAGGGLAVTTGAWSLGLGLDYLRAGSGNTAEEGTVTLLARI